MKPRARRSNMNMWVCIALGTLIVLLFAAVAAFGATAEKQYYVPNEYIIHVQSGTSLGTVERLVDRMGASVVSQLPLADTYHIKLGRSGAASLSGHSSLYSTQPVKWVIDHIQPNYVYTLSASPNDPDYPKQWGMTMINMPTAWDVEKGSDTIKVAVIDSGVAAHEDLVDRVLTSFGYDFVDKDNDPSNDVVGHGTFVAGIIAANTNNNLGVAGVCWEKVKILPIRAFGTETTDTATLVKAEDYALQQSANVVNMSYGGPANDTDHAAAIKRLHDAGIILVAAAGNEGVNVPNYPAAYDGVISVSAVNSAEALAYYSNYGTTIDIAAPGGDTTYGDDGGIYSTTVTFPASTPTSTAAAGDPVYGYGSMQGTSFASPHVAGAAALLLSAGVASNQVENRLLSTARPPVSGTMDRLNYGAGILDVEAALSNASLKILQPGKGATVRSNPEIKISILGIDTASIKVYMDPPVDENGVPLEDASSIVVSNVASYISQNMITINWSALSTQNPLSSGQHIIYVTGNASVGSNAYSDWAAFTVTDLSISAGLHLFAIPYDLSSTRTDGSQTMTALPEDLLLTLDGKPVNFTVSNSTKATLTRWIARTSSARSNGYFTYPNDLLAWSNPQDSSASSKWYTGGGFADSDYKFPAGSGFWLVLPQDAVFNSAYPAWSSKTSFSINLFQGWNMFGNPYTKQVSWSTTLFLYRGQVKSLVDAEAAGWVRSTIFGYAETPTRGYVRVSNRGLLEPYNGYWVYALVGGVSSSDSLVMTILP
ncbi:MAG: S8 family serine peptidase [Armatimonadota bacterium]